MFLITDYEIQSEVYQGNKTVIYRARHAKTGERVMIKALQSEYPSMDEIVRYKREYQIASEIDSEGIVKPLALRPAKNGVVLLFEDFGGESLHGFLTHGKLDIAFFLELAIQLAQTVGELHQKNIIHKDIKPHNIIINATQRIAKMTDFGIASRLSGERQEMLNPHQLEGTLSYMSPEQTGRMNRPIDHRADFYSLGVTFYEMLTGQLPFPATDPVELIHCHIAKQATPPHEIKPDIPQVLSDLVMKCLAKNAEDRYQSAYGLRRDLEECMARLDGEGQIEPFTLGKWDQSDLFQIPEKLYGREEEVTRMMHLFERVCRGAGEILLISGHSGIGKSFLVQEITRSIVREKGFFITGKFDPFKRHIPYSALTQALQQLIGHLLIESEQQIRRWKQRLLDALGANGQVLIDVIPELELIIGKQPALPQLAPVEAQIRFQLTMQNFLRVFTQKEHPLVLFLDDLQWADLASLHVLEYLLSDPSAGYLFFIGGYRDQEVTASDRLSLMIEELRQHRGGIEEVVLTPLTFEQTGQLMAETCQCTVDEAVPFTEVVMRKTDGNPFFIKQFLSALHRRGLLTKAYHRNRWQWDLAGIEEMEASDNVVEFMLAKIQELPFGTQEILQTAACIGGSFDLKTLLFVSGLDPQVVADDLLRLLEAGLLLPVGTEYKALYNIEEAGLCPALGEQRVVKFRFLHDRVQQASYSLLSEEDRQRMHLTIGRYLQASSRLKAGEDALFVTVNHLNEAHSLITDTAEREAVARLNLEAGSKAKAATAYEVALKYLRLGTEMLSGQVWQTDYQLAFTLYRERSEVEYLCGHFHKAEQFFDLLLDRAQTKREKAEIYNIKVILYTNQVRYQEAVETGLEALRMLGFPVPSSWSKPLILWELLKVRRQLRNRHPSELLKLPMMNDPYLEEAQKVLMNMYSSLYISDNDLFVLLQLRSFSLSLRHGYSIYSFSSPGMFGLCLGAIFGDWGLAYQFGDVALQLEKGHEKALTNKSYFGVATFFIHWNRPARESMELFHIAREKSLEAGDLLYASYSILSMSDVMLLCGMPLEEVDRHIQKYMDFIKRSKGEDVLLNLFAVRGMVWALQGRTDDIGSLSGGEFDEDAFVSSLESKTPYMRGWYYFYKLCVLYLFGQYEKALAAAEEMDRYLSNFQGRLRVSEHYFYYSLTLTALYPYVSRQEQRRFRKIWRRNQEKLKRFTRHSRGNFLHKFLLVEAEIARATGRKEEASDLYDQVIELAQDGEFLQHAAIAGECAAKLYLTLGKKQVAKTYLLEARYAYLKWGAQAKVRELDRQYGMLLRIDALPETAATATAAYSTHDATHHPTHDSLTATGHSHSYPMIDLLSVIKASRTISGEIVLDQLLKKMIEIVVENAGACKGMLLIEREGQLLIEAQKQQDEVQVLKALPFEQSGELPASVIQYVRRMDTDLVLHDAMQAEMFARDPYIAEHTPKSILCMPILNQGRSVGVLYLENTLTTHAFTKDRLELMKLLASQIAVSVENAALYQQQVELNAAYGKFVPHQFLRLLDKKNILDVRLGDHRQMEMTVLFSDIRSFTTFSETMTPEENFNFVNEYLIQMEPLVIENGGFIDKYIGDSIMSLFDRAPDDAVQAALAMLRQLGNYNTARALRGDAQIRIGIGINTGSITLGILGGHSRMESTVISDAVNLASRIEGLTRIYGVSLLISGHTYKQLQDPDRYFIRILDRVRVKGKSEEIAVYEIFDADPVHVRTGKVTTKERYQQAFALYHDGQLAEAQYLFEECLRMNPDDKPTSIYIERCKRGRDPWQENKWDM